MNLIKVYGKLKEHYGSRNDYKFKYNFNLDNWDYEEYILKLERIIQIVEYKLGIITQDEMDKDFFNENIEKNNWVMHTFTHNYKKDDNCYHYYRKCYKCDTNYYSLHSIYEQEKRSCGCK